MNKLFFCLIIPAAMVLNSCSGGQPANADTSLSANDFAQRIRENPLAPVIDVRTAAEFGKGHLPNAVNMDWNGSDFTKQVAALDKTKPVFVYCLSGGRSSAAASQMRSDGFATVYELEGGIMKWRAANLPEETTGNPATGEMNIQQFDALLNTDKTVLIDFYADWCAPCKQMKPYLEEISNDMKDTVVVVRINADDNHALCRELKIDALPFLQIYKGKNLAWSNSGYVDKATVLAQLK